MTIFEVTTLMESLQALYKKFSRLINLSVEDRQVIINLFEEVTLEKGGFLLKEGQVCDRLAFIHTGILRYFIDQDGTEQTYNFAQEGDFVCNYESLIRRTPSAKHIQAIEDSRLMIISYANLQKLYAELEEGDKFGRLHMEDIYAETIRQLVAQYTESPEARYLKFLKQFPELNQRIPQYYIASYVGVKPPSLSRIRKRLATR
jgi:CRP-like cAMP-binding protein